MTPDPTIEFELGGQQVIFNQGSKVLILKIQEPFYKAGKILGWPASLGSPGFGINAEILRFVGERKLKLLIRCDLADQKEYWSSYDRLFSFITENKSDYFINGTTLYLFPWRLFNSKPTFPIAL